MYYRRKVLLSILQAFGGQLDKMSLQKLVFLFAQNQSTPAYHFVPYRFGCYSFQLASDLSTLGKYNQVMQTEKEVRVLDTTPYTAQLLATDQMLLQTLSARYQKPNRLELVRYTYTHYPFYALRSEIKDRILDKEALKKIEGLRNTDESPSLFTIGYEGQSLEEYLVKLLKNNVSTLVDVRRNPISMKYGFSKNQLANACKGLDIHYIHLPHWGIDSEKRQELNNQEDYDALFADYAKGIQSRQAELTALGKEILTLGRVALTCFEAQSCQCHRGTLAGMLTKLPGWNVPVRHL
jgi:uncharacterized protein (DUF488 family)